MNAVPFSELIPDNELEVLPGVTPYTFLSEGTWLGKIFAGKFFNDPKGIDRDLIHETAGQEAVKFFDLRLNNEWYGVCSLNSKLANHPNKGVAMLSVFLESTFNRIPRGRFLDGFIQFINGIQKIISYLLDRLYFLNEPFDHTI